MKPTEHLCPVEGCTECLPAKLDLCMKHWRRLATFQKLALLTARGTEKHAKSLGKAVRYLNKKEAA